MKYSYISPRKKTIFSPEIQLVLTFFGLTIFMLFSTYTFLLYKDYRFMKDKNYAYEEKYDLNQSIYNMNEEITFIEKESLLYESVSVQNTVLKDSISNLFDLVPQRITLSEAQLLKNGLILYGITPNEDVYNFMLQAPLRSIFHRSYSSFHPANNGWLRFVSKNYIDEEETIEEEENNDE